MAEGKVTLRFDEADIEKAKALIRELHETIQEAKDVYREVQGAIDTLRGNIGSIMEEEVKKQVDSLGEATKSAIDDATEGIFKRFDELFKAMTEGTKRQRSRGSKSLFDLAKELNDEGRSSGS